MDARDEKKTAFIIDGGTYCYIRMPFGLKNVGATCQKVMDRAFGKQIGRNVEVYVDDIILKSKEEQDGSIQTNAYSGSSMTSFSDS